LEGRPEKVILVVVFHGGCPVEMLDEQVHPSGPHLLADVLNMPKKKKDLTAAHRERIAAQILAASEGLISTAAAMKSVGFKSPERDETTKKRVYRLAQKLRTGGNTASMASTSMSTHRQLVMEPNPGLEQQSVSSLSAPPSKLPSTSTNQGPTTLDQDALRRDLAVTSTRVPGSASSDGKKRRRSLSQKHIEEAEKNRKRKKKAAAIKLATNQIMATKAMSPSNPNKTKSQRKIVAEINEQFETNISHKTVSRMVLEGKIGVSPAKSGPVESFNKLECDAMKVAFLSFIKLEQAVGKKQSTLRELSFRVNALVNYAGKVNKKGDELAKRLKSDVADDLEVKKAQSAGTPPCSLDVLWKLESLVRSVATHSYIPWICLLEVA